MELIWACLVSIGAISMSLRVLGALSRVGSIEPAHPPQPEPLEHRPAPESGSRLEC